MTGLAALLASEPLACRRSSGADVWDVPSSGGHRRDGEHLLAQAIERLLAEGPSCFLLAEPATDLVDLGAGAWELLGDRSWRVPATLNVERFLETEVHSQGNYLIYAAPAPVSARALGAWRWWGPRREAESIARGLRDLGVSAAIAVHPDASDWMAVVASVPSARQHGMNDTLLRALQQALANRDLDAFPADGAVRFRRYPTAAVTVGAISLAQKQDTLLLHADIAFAYNAERADSQLRTCVTGMGPDAESVSVDAAGEWVRSWAPPLISVLHSEPVLGAEWIPAAAEDGLPGWDAFSSPYILRGLPDDSAALNTILETNSLLRLVRDALPHHLDASRLLHSVSLFVGAAGSTPYAEVQIDGVIVSDLAGPLGMFPQWKDAQWGTARQCLVLLNATAAAA